MGLNCFTLKSSKQVIPIVVVVALDYTTWLKKQTLFIQQWLKNIGFKGLAGNVALLPDKTGQLLQVLCVINDVNHFWGVGNLPYQLPEGVYSLNVKKNDHRFYVAWGLGAYQFTDYKKATRQPAQLLLTKPQSTQIESMVESIHWVRNLINVPTENMGPSEFGKIAAQFSRDFKLKMKQVIGKDLLKQNYPCIHLVGRASDDAPRLIDLRWGNRKHPLVTLVGKGVCFDTGGLDIKPAAGMLLMKKDMAGAAHVMGLARMIISAKLPIQLRVLTPIVENVISGNAYRPGDIVKSRKGLTIEIGNTDAEGRVILADALTEAVSEKPDLLIDITTLTGAARIALGAEVGVLFSNQDKMAESIIKHANQEQDYIWRLPLFAPYRESLNTPFADINNSSSDAYGGAITAALFLKEFVPDTIPWMHFDIMAWNTKARPGRPVGGEAMTLRAIFSYLNEKYRK